MAMLQIVCLSFSLEWRNPHCGNEIRRWRPRSFPPSHELED
jgi:hypothetical protein